MKRCKKSRLIISLVLAAVLGLAGCTAYAEVPSAGNTVIDSMSLAAASKEPTVTAAVTAASETNIPSWADGTFNSNGTGATDTVSPDGSKVMAGTNESMVLSSDETKTTEGTTTKPTTTTDTTKTTKATGTTAETTEQPANPDAGIDIYPDPTPAPEGTYSADKAQQVLVLVNQARADAGYSALTWNSTLAAACDVRAKEIAINFGHTRPDGTSERTASNWLSLGENIAMGRDLDTAQASFDCWMESPPHKDNLIGVAYDYTITGISCYCVDGVYFWVQEFG